MAHFNTSKLETLIFFFLAFTAAFFFVAYILFFLFFLKTPQYITFCQRLPSSLCRLTCVSRWNALPENGEADLRPLSRCSTGGFFIVRPQMLSPLLMCPLSPADAVPLRRI